MPHLHQRSDRQLTLMDFPNEVLLLILGNFCLHCRETQNTPHAYFQSQQQDRQGPSWYLVDCQTLHSVSMVSRRLRDLAQPILYHEFSLGYGDSWCTDGFTWSRRLIPFLRTVALRRDLAAAVRRVYLRHDLMAFLDKEAVNATMELVAQARGLQLLEFLRPFRDLWMESHDWYQRSGDELTGLLLCCLPNLTMLGFSTDLPYRGIPASSLKVSGITRIPIQTLDIQRGRIEMGRVFDGVFEMASSSLETLNLNSCDSTALMSLSRQLPKIQHLCLSNSLVKHLGFGSIFFNHTGLKTFAYDARKLNPLDLRLPPDTFEYLFRNKNSLTTIRLNIQYNQVATFANDPNFTERIPSFQDFPILRNLLLSSILIYSTVGESTTDRDVLVTLLPRSIVSLHIVDTIGIPMFSRLTNGLLRLAEAVSAGEFPSLSELKCDTVKPMGSSKIHEAFSHRGVRFIGNNALG
ncbi:hypothetical protein F4777DRAFT_592386 [Nemania sp. FL0916]|nr:hypothetical protein F4777DRAFT_592386 [Nemania sp. FL0916]